MVSPFGCSGKRCCDLYSAHEAARPAAPDRDTRAALSAADIVPDPFPPAHFSSLYLEKDEKGKITSIQLSGDDIIYKVVVGGREIASATAHPSGDDWFQFVQGLNQAKVYKWASTYSYPGQGITWVVDFAMENRKMTTGGTNEYPKAGDEGQPQADPQAGPSVPFLILWQAALALAGSGHGKINPCLER